MKIKLIYLLFVCSIGLFVIWVLATHDQAKSLKEHLTATGLLPNSITTRSIASNLSGKSLIMYHIEHPDYPHLKVHRGQFQNNNDFLTLSLKGINGSLYEYLHQTQTHSFQKTLSIYNPATDLLKSPFITLAILGESTLNLDLSIISTKTAPNQITMDLIIYKNNQVQMHFSTKLTPKQPNASLFDNLKAQPLSLQLMHISPEWKQKLDNYSLSKNSPFVTENTSYYFSF